MKRIIVVLFLLFCLANVGFCVFPKGGTTNGGAFIPNVGQTRRGTDVHFYVETPGARFFARSGGFSYVLNSATADGPGEIYRLDARLLGGDPSVVPLSEGEAAPGRYHFYLPHCRAENVLSYSAVRYTEIYPNIDMLLGIKNDLVKYDFVLRPGANLAQIRIAYSARAEITPDGGLRVLTPLGAIVEAPPVAFQGKTPVAVRFKIFSDGAVGFEADAYDKTRELIIDPLQKFQSAYFGGSDSDGALAAAFDEAGALHFTGYTASVDFPVKNGFNMALTGARDAYIAKINPASGLRDWVAVYGGSQIDVGKSLAVRKNHIAIAGTTYSDDLPLTNGLSFEAALQGQSDAFILKLDKEGKFSWVTYFGGVGLDEGYGVCLDENNRVLLAGLTNGGLPLTVAQIQPPAYPDHGGVEDGFVAQFDSLCRFKWGSYLGGNELDAAYGVACGVGGRYAVVGKTNSENFPTVQPFIATKKDLDGFVMVWSGATNPPAPLFSTYLSGNSFDEVRAAAFDAENNLYVSGTTESADFPVIAAAQATHGGEWDLFAAKFNGSFTPEWITFYGGTQVEIGASLAYDGAGNIFIGGTTESTDFPVQDPNHWSLAGDLDAVVVQFRTDGRRVRASYFGAEARDELKGFAAASDGRTAAVGITSSRIFPLLRPFNGLLGGDADAFVLQFTPANAVSIPEPLERTFLFGQTTDGFSVSLQNTGLLKIETFEISGKKIYETERYFLANEFANFSPQAPAGFYLVRFTQGNQTRSFKWTKF